MRRYHGIEIETDDGQDLTPGDYYLIRVTDAKHGGAEKYVLQTEPGRTNISHAPRTRGWLGTTNDVGRHAEGCVRVERKLDGKIHISAIDPSVVEDSEETSDDRAIA